MQIILLALILISILALIIYKINNKFASKEFIILLVIIVLSVIITEIFLDKKENKIPSLFMKKYQDEKNIEILKLSYERLNNKNITSEINFIYKFDYIIKKDGKELVCTSNKVLVKKIQDEYIFTNFSSFKETCKNK